MNYEWLLFDFDNTLVDFHSSSVLAFEKCFSDQHLEYKEDYYSIYSKINAGIWHRFELGEINTDDIRKDRFHNFFKEVNIKNIDALEFNSLYIDNIVHYTELYEGVENLLQDLGKKFKMAIVTNGLKEAQRRRLSKVGITDHFSSIVVSDEIGHAKPKQEYFEHVHKKIGRPSKDKVLLIGDSLKSDILGANNFKYNSCWIGSRKEGQTIIPDFSINHVLELDEVLEPYQRVSCDFYDKVEISAMYGKEVEIYFKDSKGETQHLISKIKTLRTKNKQEFLITEDDLEIRLDKVESLNDLSNSNN